MNYYEDNKNNEYHDSFYIPKQDNTNKEKRIKEKKIINNINSNKKILIIAILILLIVLFLIIGIVFFSSPKNILSKEKGLKDFSIEDHSYLPEFDKDTYDYYLLTTDKKIKIDCRISHNLDVEGCDKEIDLSNYTNYIHQIIVDEKLIYNIHIKIKEYSDEKILAITSVDGLEEITNKSKRISVHTESENNIKEYSFDNGLTYQKSNSILVDENQVLDIIVKDEFDNITPVKRVYVENIDKTIPSGTIIKEKSSSKEIVLKIIAKDEESGIESYYWDNGIEKDSIKVTKSGTYSVTITDKAGNENEVTIDIDDSDFTNKKQFSALFFLNGSDSISEDILVCTTSNDSCKITLPTIERENSEIIGWSTKKNSIKAEYQINEKIALSKNIKLYAVTKKKVTAIFTLNGANNLSSNSESCSYYNDNKYCLVTAPKIEYHGGKIVGFNINPDSDTLLVSPNSKIRVYDDIEYYALAFKKITINFEKNGSDSISKAKETCRLEKGKTTCTIKMPNIDRSTSDIIGWSTNKNATTTEIKPGSEIEVNKDATYYAITRKNITINFNKNGADSISSTSLTCSIYNNKKSCNIKLPTINRINGVVIGWHTNKNSKAATNDVNETISVDKNKTYYAISFKEVEAYFKSNGADTISSTTEKCTYYNDENGCNIVTPDIYREGWTIVGWHSNQNAVETTIKKNSEMTLKNTTTYYAITYKEVTVTLEKNNADSLATCQKETNTGCIATCKIYNQNTSCNVRLPYIYSKGNEVQYYSTTSNPSTKSGYTPALPITIKSNVKLYAIVDNRYRKYTYSIIKTKKYGYTVFETESGCPSSVYNNYYSFTDRAYSKVPYIFRASKVTFSGNNTFNDTWGNYSGMTYGGGLGYRNVDVKCPTSYSSYYNHTIIHELVHSWDNYYKALKGITISENSDVIALYNKYKNAGSKPLRDYSYTNYAEFIADMYSWYYFLYIDTKEKPNIVLQNTYYPSDMKKVVEKYISIAKNGYK